MGVAAAERASGELGLWPNGEKRGREGMRGVGSWATGAEKQEGVAGPAWRKGWGRAGPMR